MKPSHPRQYSQTEDIALFDLDGTLCDYESQLLRDLRFLASPKERRIKEVPRDDAPAYLQARSNLIRSKSEWWAHLPLFHLGTEIYRLAGRLGFRRIILTQGPRQNPNAWSGKKIWIDRHLGSDTDVIITRDKSLVYGKVLVDDWPDYIKKWLTWRPRGLVIMPANEYNAGFTHRQLIRYTGTPDELRRIEIRLRDILRRSHS